MTMSLPRKKPTLRRSPQGPRPGGAPQLRNRAERPERTEPTRLLCFNKPYGVLSQFTPEGR